MLMFCKKYTSDIKIEKFYLRIAGTSNFKKIPATENSEFYIYKTSLDSLHKSRIADDMAVEFVKKEASDFKKERLQIAPGERIVDWKTGRIKVFREKSRTRLEINEYRKNQNRRLQESRFLHDGEGGLKDIFLMKEKIHKNKFEITLFEIDRSKLCYETCREGAQKIPYLKNKYEFNFDNGDFKCIKESKDILTVKFPEELKKDFLDFRNSWAGRKLSTVCSAKGVKFLKSLCEYPYEPNFSVLKELCQDEGINLGDRCNPNGFKEFCEINEIQNCKTLRKLYVENPVTLLYYFDLQKCGFKDLNIIFNMISSESFKDFYKYENTALIFFMKQALKHRSEKAVWNLFRNIKFHQYARDILRMLLDYWDYISEEIKSKILYEGFTKYNHDILSKAVTRVKDTNIEFKYTKEQMALEDDVMGYKFRLPENSENLKALGDEMNNCVAGYRGRILSKASTIVYAEKDSKKRICIEIINNHIVQSYAPGNQILVGNEKKIMKQWARKKKLI